MPDITLIQVYYREWFNTPRDKAELDLIEAVPLEQSTAGIKFQVAEIVESIKPKLQESGSFYVVLKARKSDGTFGYRTVIPKTFPHRKG